MEEIEKRLQIKLCKSKCIFNLLSSFLLLFFSFSFFSFTNTVLNLFKHISSTSSSTFGFIFQFLIIPKSDCEVICSNIFSITVEYSFPNAFFKSNFLKSLFKNWFLNSSVAFFKSIISATKSGEISICSLPLSIQKLIKSSFSNIFLPVLVSLIMWIPAL